MAAGDQQPPGQDNLSFSRRYFIPLGDIIHNHLDTFLFEKFHHYPTFCLHNFHYIHLFLIWISVSARIAKILDPNNPHLRTGYRGCFCVYLWGVAPMVNVKESLQLVRIYALPCLKFLMSEDCRRSQNIFLQQGQSRIFEKAPLQGDRQVLRLAQKDSSATFMSRWVGEADLLFRYFSPSSTWFQFEIPAISVPPLFSEFISGTFLDQ